ncbi:unnamed protein product, partial [Staurois parvus]
MIGTSHRGPIQRSVFRCTQQAPDRSAARSQTKMVGRRSRTATRPCTAPVWPFYGMEEKWL